MQRVSRSTAVATLPSPPAPGTPGYFAAPDPASGIAATVPGYEWYNAVQEELIGLVTAAGLTPSATDLAQVAVAVNMLIQRHPSAVAVAGGTANAITAAFTPAITALVNGMTLYVRASSANSSTAPTFTPNSGTIAAKALVKGAGSALAAGDIAGAGHWVELQYDATLDKWVLGNPATGITTATVPDASTSVKGKIQLATAAEVASGTDAAKAVTPATLASVFSGANQSLGGNGYQQLPGGLIIQWGSVTSSGTLAGNATATFPIAFPNACLQATATACGPENMDRTVQFSGTTMNKTTLGMSALRGLSSPSYTDGILVRWVALGF